MIKYHRVYLPLLALVLFTTTPSHGQDPGQATAWDALVRTSPATSQRVSSLERRILQALTVEQFEAYLDGAPPEEIFLASGESLAALINAWLRRCDKGDAFCDGSEPPALTTVRSSPAHGDAGVAVTRETILHFSKRLDVDTVIDDNSLFASFGGQRLGARLHVSPDRQRVTLFYDRMLPASARIRVTLIGDAVLNENGAAVDADGDGRAGGTAFFDFDTLSLTALPGTRVCGRVFASEQVMSGAGTMTDLPLAGVTITVDGQEGTLFAVTDGRGRFCLDPAPAGRFFVHIDGRTATNDVPPGAYYPSVGKAWTPVIGQQVDVGNVFLPLIADGTLQPVSQADQTEIELTPEVLAANPDFAGTMLMVPADSLFADDGTRGGQVGIAPVAPDRLPGELPEGLRFPVVITVQTDGATNFDQPVSVCFPNLPDPETGAVLAPGEKSALWSFNHDTGEFEIKGPMTVSADGRLVCSDAGFGIEAPGWHGTQPGAQLEGAGDNAPDDEDPCVSPSHRRLLDSMDPDFPHPQEVLDALAATGGEFQPAADSRATSDYTFDEYSVTLGADDFPPDLTPQDYVRELLLDPNAALNNQGFNVVTEFSRVGRGSAPQIGDLYHIDILGPDVFSFDNDGSVMLTEFTGLSWRFSIVNTPVKGEHPLYGAREFGFEPLPNGDWKFYSRGVSRPANPFFMAADYVFGLKDTGWLSMMTAIPLELFRRKNGGVPPTLLERQQIFRDHPPTAKSYSLPESPSCDNVTASEPAPLKTQDSLRFHYRLQYAGVDDVEGVRLLRGTTNERGQISAILPVNVYYSILLYNAERRRYGLKSGRISAVGAAVGFGIVHVDTAADLDTDGDGLDDIAEFVLGTLPDVADSDGDGILDGAEIEQGTDPLDGRPAATGIIASVDTPGTAVDVCALDEVAIVADSERGISVFNVVNGLDPTIVAQVDTPGLAQAVACAPDVVAVADGAAGLAIADVTDPPATRIVHQVGLAGSVRAVAVAGPLAYAGTSSGQIAVVELASGAVAQELFLNGGAVEDVAIGKEVLYALTPGTLHVIPLLEGSLRVTGTVDSPGGGGAGGRRTRLFAGDRTLYATHAAGYNTFDLTNPSSPALIANGNTAQFGWKQIVANGSGLGVAAVSPNSTDDGRHHVSLYDLTDPTRTNQFITEFQTPGLAAAVSIFNGLAYVADSSAGLQVINYLAHDNQGVPPTLALTTNFAGNLAEEGKLMRLTADVSDDVQVRNVELFVDGVSRVRDGNFPFELRFVTPLLREQPSFTIRARATDTGGNVTETGTITLTLTPDATPPRVIDTSPRHNGNAQPGTVSAITATFSEPVEAGLIGSSTFRLFAAGADGVVATADDVRVGGTVSYQAETRTALLTLPAALGVDNYRAVLSGTLRDLAGNTLPEEFSWVFSVIEGTISSKPAGGNWSDVATWTEGRLPNAGDIVAIRGIVTMDTSATVQGLSIGAGATLQESAFSGFLTVTDRIVNNGNLVGPRLFVEAEGDIVNNGPWTAPLSLGGVGGRKIDGTEPIAADVTLAADVGITNDAVVAGALDFVGFTLTLNAPTVATFGGVSNTGTISGGGTLRLSGDEIEIDYAEILGNVEVGPDTIVQNDPDFFGFLIVGGDLTNHGTLRDHPLSRNLSVSVGGSLENDGDWTAATTLTGTAPRAITGSTPIAGDMTLNGDLEITNDAVVAGALDFVGFTLTLNAPTVATFGGVSNTGTISGGGTLRLSGDEIEIDYAEILGNVEVGPDTIVQNDPDFFGFLIVDGDLVNNGTIRHHPGSRTLTLDVSGTLTNNGTITATIQ